MLPMLEGLLLLSGPDKPFSDLAWQLCNLSRPRTGDYYVPCGQYTTGCAFLGKRRLSRPETTALATQRMIVSDIGMFFFAPAASLLARILLPSRQISAQSIKPFSSRTDSNRLNILLIMPDFDQRLNRLYTYRH